MPQGVTSITPSSPPEFGGMSVREVVPKSPKLSENTKS